MDRREALAVLGLVTTLTRGEPLDAAAVGVWVDLLAPLDPTAGLAAAKLVCSRQTFFPAWSEFLAAYEQVTGTGPKIPAKADALAELERMVTHRGWPDPPAPEDWSHPAVAAAVAALGSWMDVCAGEVVHNRAHFLRIYDEVATRAVTEVRVRQAVGSAAVAALPAGNPTVVEEITRLAESRRLAD